MATKREQILTHIKAQVARDGEADRHSIRLYVENRISMQAFNRACQNGRLIYDRRKAKEEAQCSDR